MPARDKPASSARREEILTSAAELFGRLGYHVASMSDIADACSVRKPTLYHYFSSKEEILFALHEQFVDELTARHLARAHAGVEPQEMVRGTVCDILRLHDSHLGHVRNFFEHHRDLTPEHQETGSLKRLNLASLVEASITEGIDQRVFAPVDAHRATLALFGVVNYAYPWFRADLDHDEADIADSIWQMVLYGLAPREGVPDQPPAAQEQGSTRTTRGRPA